MYLMKDITRDGNPVLRKRAAKVSFPLSDEDQKLAKDMMKYLEVSQDPKLCEKYKLRAGVGLAAPQVGVSKLSLFLHLLKMKSPYLRTLLLIQ